mgnify:CR=1 FL=1
MRLFFLFGLVCATMTACGKGTPASSDTTTLSDVRQLLADIPPIFESQLSDPVDAITASQAVANGLTGSRLEVEWPADISVSNVSEDGGSSVVSVALRPVSQLGWLGIATNAYPVGEDDLVGAAPVWTISVPPQSEMAQRFRAHKPGEAIPLSARIKDARIENGELHLSLVDAAFSPVERPRTLVEKTTSRETIAVIPNHWALSISGEPPQSWDFLIEGADESVTEQRFSTSIDPRVSGMYSQTTLTRIVSQPHLDTHVAGLPAMLRKYPILKSKSLVNPGQFLNLPYELPFEPPSSRIRLVTKDPDIALSLVQLLRSHDQWKASGTTFAYGETRGSYQLQFYAEQAGAFYWGGPSNEPLRGSTSIKTVIIKDESIDVPNIRFVSGSCDWRNFVTSSASDATAVWLFAVIDQSLSELSLGSIESGDACDTAKKVVSAAIEKQLIGREFQTLARVDEAVELPGKDRLIRITVTPSKFSNAVMPETNHNYFKSEPIGQPGQTDPAKSISVQVEPFSSILARAAWHKSQSEKNDAGLIVIRTKFKGFSITCAPRRYGTKGPSDPNQLVVTVRLETSE